MQTFLFSPTPEDTSYPEDTGRGIAQILAENPPLGEGMMRLHHALNTIFTFDHILLTYATEYREEEQYFLFPDVSGTEKIPLNSFREQLLVLRNGSQKSNTDRQSG